MKIAIGVLVAGFLGALARYGIGFLFPEAASPSSFPWATAFINLSGSLLLGILTGLALRKAAPGWLSEVAGTGFLGSYTTFSAFNGQLVQMLEHRAYAGAAAYVLLSALVGWGIAAIGLALGKGRKMR